MRINLWYVVTLSEAKTLSEIDPFSQYSNNVPKSDEVHTCVA